MMKEVNIPILLFVNILYSVVCYGNDTRIPVGIIDTGIDLKDKRFTPYLCETGHKDFTGEGLQDRQGHGSHISSIIARKMDKKYCLVILKYYIPWSPKNVPNTTKALKWCLDHNIKYINYSSGGDWYSEKEKNIIERLLHVGTVITVAAGNANDRLGGIFCDTFPACYFNHVPNFYVVGNLDTNGKKHSSSNFGPIITDWMIGTDVPGWYRNTTWTFTGTSQACAKVMANILTNHLQ